MDAALNGSFARRLAALGCSLAILPLAACVLAWNQAGVQVIAAFFALYLAEALYVLPAAIAWLRPGPDSRTIIRLNLTLGWSGLGWLIALMLAVWPEPNQKHRSELAARLVEL